MKEDQMNADQKLTTKLVDIGKKCNEVFLHVPSVANCLNCIRNRYCVMLAEENSLTFLSPEERMAHFVKTQHEDDLIMSLLNQNFKEFYGLKLKFENENLDLVSSIEKNTAATPSLDAFLPQMGGSKIAINGTMIEIGNLFANLFANTKNLKGDHVFDIEDVTIAKWICASFVLTSGKEFNQLTMVGYLASGRKMDQKHDK